MIIKVLHGQSLKHDASKMATGGVHDLSIPESDFARAIFEPVITDGETMKGRCIMTIDDKSYIIAMSAKDADALRRVKVKGFEVKTKRK